MAAVNLSTFGDGGGSSTNGNANGDDNSDSDGDMASKFGSSSSKNGADQQLEQVNNQKFASTGSLDLSGYVENSGRKTKYL